MKEKIMQIWNKAKAVATEAAENAKEFASDHWEGIVIGVYATYMIGMGVYSVKALRLASEQQRLEMVKTAMEIEKMM